MEIKNKPKDQITRADISELLKSIGEPGKKKREKMEAVKELGLTNFQNIDVEKTLASYRNF